MLVKKVLNLIHNHAFKGLIGFSIFLIIIFIFQKVSFLKIILFITGIFLNLKLNSILKNFFKKERPKLTSKTLDYSFPSLHSQLSMFLLASSFILVKHTLIITLPLYLVIIYQRLSQKHHYLSDIIFGSLIGFISGFIVCN
jgi:undecaprenyl-diphosphatase